jgi:hypothetical protein
LENSWNVAPLTNHGDNRYESLGEWLVHVIGKLITNWTQSSEALGHELASPAEARRLLGLKS